MKPIELCLVSLLFCLVSVSCTKVKEVPVPLQPPLGTDDTSLPKMEAVLDNAPKLTIYRAAYGQSGIKEYIDSITTANNGAIVPFTLLAPNDDAWQAQGYTLEQVRALPSATCRDLLMYLVVPGRYLPDSLAPVSGGNTLYPDIPPVIMEGHFHYYSINLAFAEGGELYLNGLDMGNTKKIMNRASDGVVYIIDRMPVKPTKTVYQILTEDDDYSFYLAALRISNQVYAEYGAGITPGDRNEELLGMTPIPFYNYLSRLALFTADYDKRQVNSYVVFAPDNEAFRKAGFADTVAIEAYIRKSYITQPRYREVDNAKPMFTNMDSVLNYSFFTKSLLVAADPAIQFEYSRSVMNLSNRVLYTNDIKWNSTIKSEGIRLLSSLNFYDWAYFDENQGWFTQIPHSSSEFSLLFKQDGNKVSLHRSDAPDGRAANIVPGHSDINALNGVIHRIDNLLLPTP